MKLGFIFPGQGSQSIGMGRDFYDHYQEVRELYEKANEMLKIDIKKLTFEATEAELAETKNTQISILMMCLGILKLLEKNQIYAKYAAGLSLGEYTALMYSKMLSLEEGIKIVRKRGELMQNYVPKGTWSMVAILGLEDEIIEEICKEITGFFVVPANYNCLGQVVVSGEKEGILQVMEKAKQRGAKRVIELNTTGPFHTSKLQVAAEHLKEELNKVSFRYQDRIMVFKNLDGKPYNKQDNIVEVLTQHMVHPVRFKEVINNMLEEGVDTFVEIGPGKSLNGFVRKMNREVTTINISNQETLEQALKLLKI